MPTGFSVLSEIPEATSAILENRVITALTKYQQFIDYIHISDQFSGPIEQEESNSLKQPETKPVLMAGFNLPKDGDMENVKPLLILIFYLMERLKAQRISKEVNEEVRILKVLTFELRIIFFNKLKYFPCWRKQWISFCISIFYLNHRQLNEFNPLCLRVFKKLKRIECALRKNF